MCMKYVNATARCFDTVLMNEDKIISFVGPFETIVGYEKNGQVVIENFAIVTEIAVLGTNNEDSKKNNPLYNNDTLYFTLRLTKRDRDPAKQVGKDLDKFVIDIRKLKETREISHACYPYLNRMHVSNIAGVTFPSFKQEETGKFVLKVLVSTTGNPKDDIIQSMTPFCVIKSESDKSALVGEWRQEGVEDNRVEPAQI